ncbi:helix-turn-helix transcriptional regulator [Xanthobacter dioxanivorans]|uniref:Helix-turn-helix transcriptional regulator n=1 Tax=Xanthobacter dioxanivorans TaxID=2528964 RepID=A0A974SKD7_9HYPH|nr:AraC family transcriptional regulator [Xanthobacter dioxanivorans]QRG09371.1 helix-turn-helix transcriptional regulator [Xanthobacter dioxanivorans]
MRDAFTPAWFDAQSAPSLRRPALFAEAFRAAMADLDIEVPRAQAFQARMLWVALPGARLASCFATGARFVRRGGEDTPAGDDARGLILLRPVGGSLPVEQCGRTVLLNDRQGALISLAHPFSYTAVDTVRVDHLLMPSGLAGAEGWTPGLLPLPATDEASLLLLVHYAGAVLQGLIPLQNAQHAALAGGHMRDLARVVFGLGATPVAATASPATAGSGRLAALKAAIAPHLGRRDLGLDMAARLLGVTPRTVQKLFEADGTTFSAHVLACRLEAARAALEARDGPGAERRVAAIAYEAGFGDLSYFNRTFRARFGLTPSAWRRRAGGMAG